MGAWLDAYPLPSRSGGEVARAKPETEKRADERNRSAAYMPKISFHSSIQPLLAAFSFE